MDVSNLTKLGGSLQVPTIQELIKDKLSRVPPRYVRPDQQPLLPHNLSSLPQIPVVDFKKLLDESSSELELQVMHNACQEWGFFQLVNHGVDPVLLGKVKSETQEFFDLPMEVKKTFVKESGDLEGYGQSFVVSEDQKLDWGDAFFIVTLPPYLRKPHLIPKLPTAFRDAIEAYSLELKSLAMKILHQMVKVLNMKNEEMETLFDEGWQVMRMNYYPPCPQPELVTGICPHSDSSGLTILLQVNEVEGLQIKNDGAWIPVSPLPNAFLINIGDSLEIITNGTYKSIEHRAITNSEKERLSIATFLSPKLDGDMGPAPSLICNENPARFKRINVTEYFRKYLSKKLDGRSNLDTMRI